jgi:hypothetical protein
MASWEDEADRCTAALTELYSVVPREAQSRVTRRPYNSPEVAGLV